MPIAVNGLFEAHLPVADLEASIVFYRDRLGLTLAHVTPARDAAFFWIGAHGRSMLGLWASGTGPQKATLHIALETTADAVVAAPRLLRAVGIIPLDFSGHPTDDPVVLAWMPAVSLYFRDPDGHLLEYLAMLPDPARPDQGVVPWKEWVRV